MQIGDDALNRSHRENIKRNMLVDLHLEKMFHDDVKHLVRSSTSTVAVR